ncbi:MAG: hypothetical protein QOG65_1223 [Actinomycetota bacterium]|nr:hypothetical protein [Actinomycetota bacterium]
MADPNNDVAKKSDQHSEVVTTRVNVAFPFSQIRVQQPTEDVAELAVLLHDLAVVLADVAPGPKTAEIAKRAQALATRLK